jgi:hypothetical protein
VAAIDGYRVALTYSAESVPTREFEPPTVETDVPTDRRRR